MTAGERTGGSAGPRRPAGPAQAARAAATAVLLGVGAVLVLHVVRPDLAATSHRLSEYAVGPWSWLMTAAFLSLAVGAWLLRRALAAGDLLRPVRLLLAVAAGGLVLSALFPTDATRPDAVREAVHSAASGGALLALALAAGWSVVPGATGLAWGRGRGVARVVAAGAAVGVALGPVAHDGPWTGAVQRLTCAFLVVWMLVACHAIATGARTDPSGDAPHGGRAGVAG